MCKIFVQNSAGSHILLWLLLLLKLCLVFSEIEDQWLIYTVYSPFLDIQCGEAKQVLDRNQHFKMKNRSINSEVMGKEKEFSYPHGERSFPLTEHDKTQGWAIMCHGHERIYWIQLYNQIVGQKKSSSIAAVCLTSSGRGPRPPPWRHYMADRSHTTALSLIEKSNAGQTETKKIIQQQPRVKEGG